MQRHIRTCDYIPAADRARIMENFEASQAASRSPRELEDPRGSDGYSRHGHGQGGGGGEPGMTMWAPHTHHAASHHHQHSGHHAASSLWGRSRATSQSDDDTTSSSSFPSPDLTRRELTRLASPPSRPSPKLQIRDLLNEESDPPSYLFGSSASAVAAAAPAEKSKYPRTSPSGDASVPKNASAHISELATEHGLVAQLNYAIDEMQGVRMHLEGRSGPRSGGHSPVSGEESAATIAWLSKRMEELRRENETLRRRVSTTENDNGELKAKLERIGEKFRSLEHDSRRVSARSVGGGDGRRPFDMQQQHHQHHMATPRAASAPAVTATESEMLRKRRRGEERQAVGFVPIDG